MLNHFRSELVYSFRKYIKQIYHSLIEWNVNGTNNYYFRLSFKKLLVFVLG